MKRDDRRDPFASLDSDEPAEALGMTTPTALTRRPTVRKASPTPSEKRRRARKVGVTFSDPSIPERLRALAERWEMFGPDGKRPNVSAVVEYLLVVQLEAAESGEIIPPGRPRNGTD